MRESRLITGRVERVRKEKGHWRGGSHNRSSKKWSERHRIGRAIKSHQGLMYQHLHIPIQRAKSTIELHSFRLFFVNQLLVELKSNDKEGFWHRPD